MKKKSTKSISLWYFITSTINRIFVNNFTLKERVTPNFRIFTFLLIFFLVGVFVSSFFDLDFYLVYPVAIVSTILALGFLLITKEQLIARTLIFVIFAFYFGFVLFAYKNTFVTNNRLQSNNQAKFTATVIDYPETSGTNQKLIVVKENTKLLITTSKNPEYFYGDKIEIEGAITKPENFSGFNYQNYLKKFGITNEVKNPKIKIISQNNGSKIIKPLFIIRKKFENSIMKNLPEPESSLAIGLDIGSKQGFSKEIMSQFSKIGITHIIALSGYNVTIIIVFLTDILLGILTKRQIFLFSTIIIILFDIMTGGSSSIVRASIITLVITFGKTIGRKADMTNLLLLSASIMVMINPFILLYDTGFLLSFFAFAGLIYVAPIIEKLFCFKGTKIIPDFIKSAFTETTSAQITVLPILLATFGQFSLIAPITNMLILPIIPVTMLFIFLSALIDFTLPAIGHLAYLICYFPLKYIILIADKFSKIPLASIAIPKNFGFVFIFIYSILVLIGLILIKRKWAEKSLI